MRVSLARLGSAAKTSVLSPPPASILRRLFFNVSKAVKLFWIECAAQAITDKVLQVMLKIAMRTVYTKQYAKAARSFKWYQN